MGTLFSENRHTTNFQFLEDLKFKNFQCGHDFVVAVAMYGRSGKSVEKVNAKSLVRCSTQSAFYQNSTIKQGKMTSYKKRQPSEIIMNITQPNLNTIQGSSLSPIRNGVNLKTFDSKTNVKSNNYGLLSQF